MRKAIFAFLFTLVCLTPSSTQTLEQEKLRGLPGVSVLIEGMPVATKSEAIDQQQLKTEAELRLRRAGIRVFTFGEIMHGGLPVPTLYVNFNAIEVTKGFYAVSLEVEVHDSICLLRDPSVKTIATTWDKGFLLAVRSDRIREVKDTLGDMIEEFANAYLAANPPRR